MFYCFFICRVQSCRRFAPSSGLATVFLLLAGLLYWPFPSAVQAQNNLRQPAAQGPQERQVLLKQGVSGSHPGFPRARESHQPSRQAVRNSHYGNNNLYREGAELRKQVSEQRRRGHLIDRQQRDKERRHQRAHKKRIDHREIIRRQVNVKRQSNQTQRINEKSSQTYRRKLEIKRRRQAERQWRQQTQGNREFQQEAARQSVSMQHERRQAHRAHDLTATKRRRVNMERQRKITLQQRRQVQQNQRRRQKAFRQRIEGKRDLRRAQRINKQAEAEYRRKFLGG